MRRFPFIGLVLLTALLVAGSLLVYHAIVQHRQRHQEARKEAFLRADRLSLYSQVEFLEEHRGQNIAELIAGAGGQTNVNAALVDLLAPGHVSFPVPVSNFAGSYLFVDPWGLPLRFTLVTNAEVSRRVGRHIESRMIIERGHRP